MSNTTLYRRWIEDVWNKKDMRACDELMAKDLVDHNAMPGMSGRQGHDMTLEMMHGAFPDLRFTVDVVFSDGDLVTGRWTMVGTQTGPIPMLGLPPTGKKVVMTGQEIMRIRDGKIVEIWHQEDVAGMLMQLGVIPPPPPP